ncbi:hypothetical protein DQ04_01661120, partial [Trypanosoma grayi]|uniref:hypothetical protein n=1 Tax=Trypanosoma grayi TaxID=71804 RepID=UPI0004F402B7
MTSAPPITPATGGAAAAAAAAAGSPAMQESSQRVRELLDEVARKDNALQQIRALFESLSSDYEVVQRRGERAQLELASLTTQHETQQQELIALKAKSALLESRVKLEDDEWDRRTRQLRQELAAAVEERDSLAKEREAQWRQTRSLRAQLDEQRCQHEEAEVAWRCRLDEARREAEEK